MGTIYCIGRNYAEHAKELGNAVPAEPVVFLKSWAALRPLKEGPLAFPGETFHHEAELVLRLGKSVPLGGAPTTDVIDGLALGLDLTRREVQSALKAKGLPWTTAKSFAGSAVLTRFVAADSKRLDAVAFALAVNGETKQSGTTKDMLFNVPVILKFLASLAPLVPGDLIFTGTPPGVGPIKHGDKVRLWSADLGIDESGTL